MLYPSLHPTPFFPSIVDNNQSRHLQPSQLPASLHGRQPAFFDRPVILSHQQDGICMSTAGFSAFMVMAVALIAAVVTITGCMLFRSNNKQ
jgi:hypothetical protein